MSLRAKLILFFAAIVAIPMAIVGVVLVDVAQDARVEQTDAGLEAGAQTARAVYEEALADAPGEAERIARVAGPAARAGDRARLARLAERERRRDPDVVAVIIRGPGGKLLASAGPRASLGAGRSTIRTRDDDGTIVHVRVTTMTAAQLIARVRSLTDRRAAVLVGERTLAGYGGVDAGDVPAHGDIDGFDVDVAGDEHRGVALPLAGAPDGARLVLLAPAPDGFLSSEPFVAAILIVFFLVAFVLAALLLRAMRHRLSSMLAAARRIGVGDFDVRVPVTGNDEMADLARELNRMSVQLGTQMDALRRSRHELDETVRRLGEAFASGLDRASLLETVLDSARVACGAEAGRVIAGDDGSPVAPLRAGAESPELDGVLERALAEASRHGDALALSEGDRHALGIALVDRRDPGRVLCTLALARAGEPFAERDRKALRYLIGQAAVSIENIDLHERLAEQALTDGMTGLSNHRHFVGWMEAEVERAKRFGSELALILIDIDDFKAVNDTRGHLQGDAVLAAVAAVLRGEARSIDEVARWGGEEFVVALPETPREGALEMAERLRRRIAALEVDPGERGEPIRITASLGIAAIPDDADDMRSLIAAADRGLYLAKQDGKDRVAFEAGPPEPLAQGKPAERRS